MNTDELIFDVDPPSIRPAVTFLIPTRDRREVLLTTLAKLAEVDRRGGLYTETVVVDNASRDGTADAIAAAFPAVRVVRLNRNRGPCGRNAGLAVSSGEYVVFLDDDSYPADAASVRRMVDHFDAEPGLGAAVFDVRRTDGSPECSTFPAVTVGCGTAFRRDALREVGGLPDDFVVGAEDLDLSLRLLEARWDVRRFDDMRVEHLRTPADRVTMRTTRLDVRNHLLVAARRLPRAWAVPYAVDWTRRAWWVASKRGRRHQLAAACGVVAGVVGSLAPGRRRPIGLAAFERFATTVDVRRRMERVVGQNRLQSIALVDVGRNLLPFHRAAEACGVRVVAVADDHFAGRRYRGVPVVTDEQASRMIFDAAFVADVSPVHAARRTAHWRASQGRPVFDLFERVEAKPMRRAA